MATWFLKSLGISEEVTRQLDSVSWVWARPGWLLVGLALLLPAAWFIHTRHAGSLGHSSSRVRRALTLCRVSVLVLLVFVIGGPYLRLEETLEHKPILALLYDESGSMSLPAGPFDVEHQRPLAHAAGMIEPNPDGTLPPVGDELRSRLNALTRAELLHLIRARAFHPSNPLHERYEVRSYGVSGNVRRLSAGSVEELDTSGDITSSDTSLGAALEQVAADAMGRQLAAAVVFSDGQNTTAPDPTAVARRLNASSDPTRPQFPVVTVPIGSPASIADVALIESQAPLDVAKGDSVSVVATLVSRNLANQAVQVVLREGSAVLETVQVTLDGSGRQQVTLPYEAHESGTRIVTVEVSPHELEKITNNNTQTLAIRVSDEKIKLLILEGIPRWDLRFLDHALRRDKAVESRIVMESLLQASAVDPANYASLAQVPGSAAQLGEFHVVILGDVSPQLLTPELQQSLVEAVETRGLGVIVASGTEHMPQAYLEGPLERLLPVTIQEPEAANPGGELAPPFQPFRMVVTPAGSAHPAFALYSEASRNRQTWSRMPPFFWASRGGRGKPGATLLAEYEAVGGRSPLISEHLVGAGRVLMLGTDETFRWRHNIGDTYFYRFWGQTLRHVARKKTEGERGAWLAATPYRLEPGLPVTLELYATRNDGQPLSATSASLRIEGREAAPLVLRRDEKSNLYRGAWTPEQPGLYSFVYTGDGGAVLRADVFASAPDREFRNVAVDRAALGALADLAGREMLEPHQLSRLPELLTGQTVITRRSHEEEIWDNWLVLLLLAGLYCLDVGIRRLTGLN